MERAVLLLTAALVLQGAPPILYLDHDAKRVRTQLPFFTDEEWMCLALCCQVDAHQQETNDTSLQSEPTDLQQCFTDTCSGLCETVCCVSGMLTPVLRENFVLDSANCLKHTCKVTENGTYWEAVPMPCRSCGSDFVKIPGQCCPHCISRESGEWGEWSECSVSCGEGLQSSVRPCYQGEAGPAATHCPVHTLRTRTCHKPCPVPCVWKWSEYSDCTVTCGGGFRVRHMNITQEARNGGTPCPDDVINATELQECNSVACPASCDWIWSEMSECTVTCGGGTQYRYPILSQPPSKGGEPCPHYIVTNKTEKYQCNVHRCPVPCLWVWSSFTGCKTQCKGGLAQNRGRYPIVIQQALEGGRPCPDMVERNRTDELQCPDEICQQLGSACGLGESVCHGVCIKDRDEDCIPDNQDNCPDDPNPSQRDSDKDDVGDLCDNCPQTQNSKQRDRDHDRVGNACDNCPHISNYYQEDTDGDGRGDECDKCRFKPTEYHLDQDRDGIGDECDNCPFLHNPDQEDRDGDFLGYKCEADKDGDGHLNHRDNCPLLYNPRQEDYDHNGVGDACQYVLLEPPLMPFNPNELR